MHWTGVIVGRSSAKRVFRILPTFVTPTVATSHRAYSPSGVLTEGGRGVADSGEWRPTGNATVVPVGS